MTLVRCYFLDGLTAINGHASPKLPYIGRSVCDVSTTPTATEPAPGKTSHVYVQIPRDSRVLYELVPANLERDVDKDSPELIAGSHILVCGPGWTLKFLETEG